MESLRVRQRAGGAGERVTTGGRRSQVKLSDLCPWRNRDRLRSINEIDQRAGEWINRVLRVGARTRATCFAGNCFPTICISRYEYPTTTRRRRNRLLGNGLSRPLSAARCGTFTREFMRPKRDVGQEHMFARTRDNWIPRYVGSVWYVSPSNCRWFY